MLHGWRMLHAHTHCRRSRGASATDLGLPVHRMSAEELDACVAHFARLARLNGMSLEEVAVANSIAAVTARNQLSAAMRKMGVRRQQELVAVMSSMAPSIALGGDDR